MGRHGIRLLYRHWGKQGWYIATRRDRAYVWQLGRFKDDVAFWQKLIGDDANVEPVEDGKKLRFYLTTAEALDAEFE